MATIRNQVLYEVKVFAHDISSSKPITTKQYLKNAAATTPTVYGAAIPGSGSTTTLLANFATAWETLAAAVLSTKYQLEKYEMRALLGYDLPTPFLLITGLTATGTVVTVQTAVVHGLFTGDLVKLDGITSPTGLNGIWGVIVDNPTTFHFSDTAAGAWTGPGTAQRVTGAGPPAMRYGDFEELATVAAGGKGGDALPIYADIDVQRINLGIGRNWRSRFALAPIPETFNDFGKIQGDQLAGIQTALDGLLVGMVNGGSEGAASGLSFLSVFSKKLAQLEPSPFTQSLTYSLAVQSLNPHIALGTQLQRKPKVSSLG